MAVISISRQFGAGGKTLSEDLALRLGFKFVDEDLVNRVAQEAKVADEWVRISERETLGGERSTGLLSSTLLLRLLGEAPQGPEQQLIDLFRKHIPLLAAQGNVVFLERGSQFILPSGKEIIRVLLVASEEFRIGFIMEHYNVSADTARDTIKLWDKNRLAFLRWFGYEDPDNPSLYDIVINTSLVRLHWALGLIANLVKKRDQALGSTA